jgi:hypothetical protein
MSGKNYMEYYKAIRPETWTLKAGFSRPGKANG